MGPRTDSLTSMLYLGFKPGTFGVAAGSPRHYTIWSAVNSKVWEDHRSEIDGDITNKVFNIGLKRHVEEVIGNALFNKKLLFKLLFIYSFILCIRLRKTQFLDKQHNFCFFAKIW